MLPSDALVIKQVLESMVLVAHVTYAIYTLQHCEARGLLWIAGHQRIRTSCGSSTARLHVQKRCRSFAGCGGELPIPTATRRNEHLYNGNGILSLPEHKRASAAGLCSSKQSWHVASSTTAMYRLSSPSKPASKTTCIFCWVQAFSNRAGSAKKEVGMEDVMLAIQAKATTSFVAPPPQDVSSPVTTHSCMYSTVFV